MMRTIQIVTASALFCQRSPLPNAQAIDWARRRDIARSAAVAAKFIAMVFHAPICRVTLDGVTIRPTLALGGWIAFQPMHGAAMVMGDLVLLQSESAR